MWNIGTSDFSEINIYTFCMYVCDYIIQNFIDIFKMSVYSLLIYGWQKLICCYQLMYVDVVLVKKTNECLDNNNTILFSLHWHQQFFSNVIVSFSGCYMLINANCKFIMTDIRSYMGTLVQTVAFQT